jgi:hypothetical protein
LEVRGNSNDPALIGTTCNEALFNMRSSKEKMSQLSLMVMRSSFTSAVVKTQGLSGKTVPYALAITLEVDPVIGEIYSEVSNRIQIRERVA